MVSLPTNLDELTRRFWDPAVMMAWQRWFQQHQNHLHQIMFIDNHNLIRLKSTKEPIAYLGGSEEKAEIGLNVTNWWRSQTSSFQYVLAKINQPLTRPDGLKITGSLEELLAEDDLADWLSHQPVDQRFLQRIYSITAQLFQASEIAHRHNFNCQPALNGIKIRQVPEETTVPFFQGSLKTFGVIPVIYSLDLIQVGPGYPPATLDVVLNYLTARNLDDLLKDFKVAAKSLDLTTGTNWNYLTQLPLYQDVVATASCQEKFCPNLANGTGNLEESTYQRDLQINYYANLDEILEYIQPYAKAIQVQLSKDYPNQIVFQTEEVLPQSLVYQYLDLEKVQETYFQLAADLSFILEHLDRSVRPVTTTDLLSPELINTFYWYQDNLVSQLETGDIISYDTITILEYHSDEDTFKVEDTEGQLYFLTFDQLINYLARVEQIRPYKVISIPRYQLSYQDNEIIYRPANSSTQLTLRASRVYVDNFPQQTTNIDTSQHLMALILSYLYQRAE